MKSKMYKWLLPLLTFAIIAPFTPSLDLALSHLFYTPALEGKGHFVDNGFTLWMYTYGEKMGFLLGFISLGVFFLSWIHPYFKKWRRGALSVGLTLALGAGIIVNGVLKEVWGRPRPKQIEEFGGKLSFRPFYKPQFQKDREPQKSFPSGHVTMGCCYFSLCFVALRYRSRWLLILGALLTVGMSLSLAWTRIVQGGHFLSDVLFSALIMWLTSLFIDWLVFESSLFKKSPLKLLAGASDDPTHLS